MTHENRLERATVHEIAHERVPGIEIAEFHNRAVQLFENARQPFGRQDGVGSIESKPLIRARYRSSEGKFVTIANPTSPPFLEGIEVPRKSIAVYVETPLTPTPKLPNFYIEEKFTIGFGGEAEDYDYALGTNEYSPDGHYILSARTVEQVRKEYWQEMGDFPAECTHARFTDRLLMLLQLSAADEIGCEPNPYNRSQQDTLQGR